MKINEKKIAGFTLVELLLVVAIIGILASVIFMGMGSTRQRARAVSAMETQSSVMGLAVDCYLKNKGIVPISGNSGGSGRVCELHNDNWPEINESCKYDGGTDKTWRITCQGDYVIECNVEKGNCVCSGC